MPNAETAVNTPSPNPDAEIEMKNYSAIFRFHVLIQAHHIVRPVLPSGREVVMDQFH